MFCPTFVLFSFKVSSYFKGLIYFQSFITSTKPFFSSFKTELYYILSQALISVTMFVNQLVSFLLKTVKHCHIDQSGLQSCNSNFRVLYFLSSLKPYTVTHLISFQCKKLILQLSISHHTIKKSVTVHSRVIYTFLSLSLHIEFFSGIGSFTSAKYLNYITSAQLLRSAQQ